MLADNISKSHFWFTADTHFNHVRTLELSRRPFSSINEMNDCIIAKWNNRVNPEDTVIHIGDFGEPQFSKKLNGNIFIIPGNYEREAVAKDANYYKQFEEFNPNVKIINETLILTPGSFFNNPEFKKFFTKVVFHHEPPINSPAMGDSHICNLFGHIHKLQMVKPYGLNVGTDAHNFAPIGLDTVEFYINGILNYYDSNVFC